MKLASAINEFVSYKRALGSKCLGESNRLRAFLQFTGDIDLASLTRHHVESYLPVKDQQPGVRGWFWNFQVLRVFFRFARERGYIQRDVMPIVYPERPPQFVPYIFSVSDMRRLLGVPDTQYRPNAPVSPATMRAFLLLLYGTGLRPGEAMNLKASDIDMERAVLTVRNTKFYKSRLVSLGNDVVAVLRNYQKNHFPDGRANETPFFRNRLGTAVNHNQADHEFQWLRLEANVLRFDTARFQPRLHDLRQHADFPIMPTVFD